MKIEKKYQQIVDSLLTDICPASGAAVLLLKHSIGPVFFPLALVHGSSYPGYPDGILDWYFLFSMQINTDSDDYDTTYGKATPIEDLVLHGKLAVALFESDPIVVKTYFCDEEKEIAICTFQPSDSTKPDPITPSLNIRHAIANCVAVWKYSARTSVQIDSSEPKEVADYIASHVSDKDAAPPYYSVLFAAIDWRKGSKGKMTEEKWQANALAHNCYLIAHHESLVTDYIKSMVENSRTTPYYHKLPENTKGLPAAIASQCTDLVHHFATLRGAGVRMYARRNIPTQGDLDNQSSNIKLDRDFRTADDLWSLLKISLKYLMRQHSDSLLVTVWLGYDTNDGDNLQDALPIGLAPGERVENLGKIACHSEVSQQCIELCDENNRLFAKCIQLGTNVQSDNRQACYEETLSLLEEILERGSKAIQGMYDYLPGPYLLDFHRLVGALTIKSINNPNDAVREVNPETEKDLWDFLLDLCEAHKTKTNIISHNHIKDKWAPSTGPAKFVESLKEKLRNKSGEPAIDPKSLFINKKGHGWKLVEGVVYKGLTAEVFSHGVENIDSF